MDRILITGAGGLVGSGIYDYLINKKKLILGTFRDRKTENTPANHLICDLYMDNLDEIFSAYDIECIIHCAAKLPIDNNSNQVYIINRKIDDKIIEYVSKHNIKLIYISGIGIERRAKSGFQAEQYFRGKLESELSIKTYCKKYEILRLSSPYGLKQKNNNVLKIFIEKAIKEKKIEYFGTGSRTQNFINVFDIATSVEKAMEYNGNEIFNIASKESISMKKLAETVSNITSHFLGAPVSVIGGLKPDPQEEIRNDQIDITKTIDLLKWTPVINIKKGIENWIKNLMEEI